MKHLLSFLFGLAAGIALFAVLMYVNPLAGGSSQSPLVGVAGEQLAVDFDETPAGAIAWIGNGENPGGSRPPMVQELAAGTVRHTRIYVLPLTDGRGQPIGVGVKYTTQAEEPGLLLGDFPAHGTWQLWLPGRGGIAVFQEENHWPFLRDVIAGAYLESGNNWRGEWRGVLTDGPAANGAGHVYGGSGAFAGRQGLAAQSREARAWSASSGPAEMRGRLELVLKP